MTTTRKVSWSNLTSRDPRKARAVELLRSAAGARGPARVTLCKVTKDGRLARGTVHPAHGASGGVYCVDLETGLVVDLEPGLEVDLEPVVEPAVGLVAESCGSARCGCCSRSCACVAAGESPLRCAEHAAPTCYACDAPATGTRDRSHDAERGVVPACERHADNARSPHRWHNVQLRVLASGELPAEEVERELSRALRELVAPGRFLADVAGPLVAAAEPLGSAPEGRSEHVVVMTRHDWRASGPEGRMLVVRELTETAARMVAAAAWRCSVDQVRAERWA